MFSVIYKQEHIKRGSLFLSVLIRTVSIFVLYFLYLRSRWARGGIFICKQTHFSFFQHHGCKRIFARGNVQSTSFITAIQYQNLFHIHNIAFLTSMIYVYLQQPLYRYIYKYVHWTGLPKGKKKRSKWMVLMQDAWRHCYEGVRQVMLLSDRPHWSSDCSYCACGCVCVKTRPNTE